MFHLFIIVTRISTFHSQFCTLLWKINCITENCVHGGFLDSFLRITRQKLWPVFFHFWFDMMKKEIKSGTTLLREMKCGCLTWCQKWSNNQWTGCKHVSSESERQTANLNMKDCSNYFLGQKRDLVSGLNAERYNNKLWWVLHYHEKIPSHHSKQAVCSTVGRNVPAQTQGLITSFRWDQSYHLPYRPNFATSDYHFFWYLKHFFGGQRFNDEEVKLQSRIDLITGCIFFEIGILKLVERYDKCLNKCFHWFSDWSFHKWSSL